MNIKFAIGELKEVNMENNFIQGIHGKYNFYVIAFDSQNHFTNYGNEHIDLTLKQAQEIYSKTVLENPKHVNTMLGVAYSAEKLERDRYGTDAVDLLQCIDGKIKLCEDYKQSPLLSAEGLIAVNTVNILKKASEICRNILIRTAVKNQFLIRISTALAVNLIHFSVSFVIIRQG